MQMDVPKILKRVGIEPADQSSGQYRFNCWFCDPPDTGAHLYMNEATGQYICYKCEAKGNFASLGWVPGKVRSGILWQAARYYRKNFIYTDYWRNRGLSEETLAKFGIGFAEWQGSNLRGYLEIQGFIWQQLMGSGLFRGNGKEFFAGMITIPYSEDGRVTTIRGRVVEDETRGKYFGMRGDSSYLFNADAIADGKGVLLVCEGEFDAMFADQKGFRAVGVPGAQIFPDGFAQKLSQVNDIAFVYDGDNPGINGMDKAIAKLGKPARKVTLPINLDLGDFLLEHPAEELQALIDSSDFIYPDPKKGVQTNRITEPNSLSCEIAVVAAMVHHPELIESGINRLKLHHFIDDICREAFLLFSKVGEMSIGRLSELIKRRLSRELHDGLTTQNPGPEKFISLLSTLEELYVRREVIAGAHDLTRLAAKESMASEEISGAIANLHSFSVDGSGRIQVVEPGQFGKQWREAMESPAWQKSWETGYPDLDNLTTIGFQPGMLSIIAGAPSMGKSLLRENLKFNLCGQGAAVLDISPEQDLVLEMNRVIGMGTGISVTAVSRYSTWAGNDKGRVKEIDDFLQKLDSSWGTYFVPNRDISWGDVVSVIRRIKIKNGLDVVFIDLFDRLSDLQNVRSNEIPYLIGYILDKILTVAKQENVHVCLLVQIGRIQVTSKKSIEAYRPTLDHLYASSAYRQRGDLIMLLFRPGYYDRNQPDNILEVEVAKQRNGVTGIVKLNLDRQTLRLTGTE